MENKLLSIINNKKVLIGLIVGMIFFLVALYYYKANISLNKTLDEYVSIYGDDEENENIIGLNTGDIIQQQVTLYSGSYNGLAMGLKYKQFSMDSTIHVRILNSQQEVVGEGDINHSNVDGSIIKIPFSANIDIDSEGIFSLEIMGVQINENDAISLKVSDTFADNDKSILINGNPYSSNLDISYVHTIKDTITIPLYIFLVGLSFVIVLICLYFGLNFSSIHYEKCFLVLFPLVCACYLIMFTPQTIADEQLHFDSAYQYSNIMLFKSEQRDYKRTCDLAIKDDVIIEKEYYRNTNNQFSLTCDDTALVKVEDRLVQNAPFAYIPSGLGISIARILGLGAIPLYTLGRIFNALACYGLIYLAIKKIPFGKSVLFVLTMIPMVPHLIASYSYDGFIISLSFLLTAYILKMAYGDEPISRKDLAVTAIISICLAPCKLVYASICCLAFIIPKEKMVKFKYKYWPQTLMILLAIFSILFFQLSKIADIGSGGGMIEWAGRPGYTLDWALAYPTEAIKVFINTIIVYGGQYLLMLIGSALGWLRIQIPWFVTNGFAIILALSLINKKDDQYSIKPSVKIWALLLFTGSSIVIMYSMFTGHTPIGNPTIEGVQGRYFIPLLPLLYLVLKNNFIVADKKVDNGIIILSGLFHALAVITAFVSIINF